MVMVKGISNPMTKEECQVLSPLQCSLAKEPSPCTALGQHVGAQETSSPCQPWSGYLDSEQGRTAKENAASVGLPQEPDMSVPVYSCTCWEGKLQVIICP